MQQFRIQFTLFSVSRQNTSEATATVDMKYKTIIHHSSTIIGNNLMAIMRWIRLSLHTPISLPV
jgi:hypothetical protein